MNPVITNYLSIKPKVCFTFYVNTIHRIPSAIRIRTNIIILLPHRIRHKPAGESRTVLPCTEVGVADAEVRPLVLLAREPVAQGDSRTSGGQTEV